MYPTASTQQPAAICALKSPADAIHILEAVRLGLVPRVTRRLTGPERAMIRPGTVWVWEEEETNMRRWTDGRRWGASRVGGGGFLVYTESSDNHSPPPPRQDREAQGGAPDMPYNSYNKVESLIKQTYSTSMTHPATGKAKKFHVVAYSSKHNPQGDANNPLPLPHQLPILASIKVTPGVWPEWEHKREQEYNSARRAASFPPSHMGGSAPPSTMHSNDRARSPMRDGYAAHPSSSVPPTRYPPQYAAYPPPQAYIPPRESFPPQSGNNVRPVAYPPPPSLQHPDRFHPYSDHLARNRPYYQAPNSAPPTSAPPLDYPMPNTPQDISSYEREFRDPRYTPAQTPTATPARYSPTQGFAPKPDVRAYSQAYPSPQSNPTPSFYYDASLPPDDRRSDGTAVEGFRPNISPSNSHLLPPNYQSSNSSTSVSPNGGMSRLDGSADGDDRQNGKSPRMSLGQNILNPAQTSPNGAVSVATHQNQYTSAPNSTGKATNGNFTLPPLRLAVDKEGERTSNPSNSPTYEKRSPGRLSESHPLQQAQGDMVVKGEEARQLGELGRKVSL